MEVFRRFRPIFERIMPKPEPQPELITGQVIETEEPLAPVSDKVGRLKHSLAQMHFWMGVLEGWATELDEVVSDEFLNALAEARYSLNQAEKYVPNNH